MHRGTIAEAISEYLDVLDDLTDGASREYFGALHTNRPGAWHAMICNLRYGLDHFPPGTVADMCCGDGLQAFVFARHGHHVVGVDIDEPRLELARKAAVGLGVDIEYRTGDATVEIRKLHVSAIWMHRAIGHIKGLPQYLDDCRDALEPGGALVFITSNSTARSLVPGARRGQKGVREMRGLLVEHGFEVRDVRHHGYLTGLPDRFLPTRVEPLESALSSAPVVRRLGGSFSMTGVKARAPRNL